MEKDSSKYMDKSGIVEEITQTKYGDHNLILYSDLATLEYAYLNYIKRSLESLNEIILILPHYHCVADVINSITNTSIDIDNYKKEGSLVVVQSKKAYYSLTHEFVGVMIMTKMLIQRAYKLGKAGVTVISDMALFFNLNKIDDLIKYETELSSSICNTKAKVLCCYSKSDFELFIEHQRQQNLLKAHNNKIFNLR
ncbi:MAG: MEDS domain-containing protein [Nitrososphaeraceae archaeon]